MQIGVITNPRSRKNRNRPHWAAQLQSILGSLGEVHETPDVDAIKPVLREFLRRRARYWVADGGDGALHWMVRMGMEVLQEQEFAGSGIELPTTLPTNGGTIDFVAHNVGLKGGADEMLGALRRAIEAGRTIDEVEVDSMLVDAVEVTADGDRSIRTYGFASAIGGVGQRFFTKYLEEKDPNPRSIVKIIGNALASFPVAMSPLRALPLLPRRLRTYARELFRPTPATIHVDGMTLPWEDFTCIHLASMSIDLGGLKFFSKADEPGLMHALVGAPSPLTIVRNLPRMYTGAPFTQDKMCDRVCRVMTVEAASSELLAPIIDGESYPNLRRIDFRVGPRVRIPKVVTRSN